MYYPHIGIYIISRIFGILQFSNQLLDFFFLIFSNRLQYKCVLKVADGANFDINSLFIVEKYYVQMKLSCP